MLNISVCLRGWMKNAYNCVVFWCNGVCRVLTLQYEADVNALYGLVDIALGGHYVELSDVTTELTDFLTALPDWVVASSWVATYSSWII